MRLRNIASATKANAERRDLRAKRAAQKYRDDPATRTRLRDNYRRLYQDKYRHDSAFMLRKSISTAIRRAAGNAKARSRWFTLVGYGLEELRAHLERQFQSGMSWANYGDWHVDHIQPLASFDFSLEPLVAVKAAWALANLRPLWRRENMKKHAKRTHLL